MGTDDPQTQQAIKTMITELKKQGHTNLLDGIAKKNVTLLQAYTKWSTGSKTNNTVASALPFYKSAVDWIDAYDDVKQSTKDGYTYCFKELRKLKASFSVEQVPEVMKDYRKVCQKARKPRAFNTCRNAVRSYLNNTFGKHDPTYIAVAQIKTLTEAPSVPRALSVAEVKDLLLKLRADVAAQFWTMCITGAGLTEYLAGLSVEGNGIRIKGEKMARIDDRRNRLVPHVENPAPLVLEKKQFASHIRKASNGAVKVSDSRKAFARWCLEAEIEPHRVEQYMGHRVVGMTQRYAKSTVDQHLVSDAQLLREYLTKGPRVSQQVTQSDNEVYIEEMGGVQIVRVPPKLIRFNG